MSTVSNTWAVGGVNPDHTVVLVLVVSVSQLCAFGLVRGEGYRSSVFWLWLIKSKEIVEKMSV